MQREKEKKRYLQNYIWNCTTRLICYIQISKGKKDSRKYASSNIEFKNESPFLRKEILITDFNMLFIEILFALSVSSFIFWADQKVQ